ncbi:MAG: glycerate kinase [Anaerolineae bacterium]|nr:glycerate kinase [Anaerolineae bacterium]
MDSHTVRTFGRGDAAGRILKAALQAVDPYRAVQSALHLSGSQLHIGSWYCDLQSIRRVLALAVGKAAAPMLEAVCALPTLPLQRGVLITKEGHTPPQPCHPAVEIYTGGHPVPDERSLRAADAVRDLLADCRPDDLLLCLISGGGSALLTSPAEGIRLADLQELTGLLLRCGATIHEINTLRKHLETLKGGNLARLAAPAQVAALILSDVVGDPLEVIASGPTVPDPTTFGDALDILERYALRPHTPPAILQRLEEGRAALLPETPKPGDPLFANVHNQVVAGNLHAARAALQQAQAEGFHPLLITTHLQGEARHAGALIAAIARQIASSGEPVPRPACVLLGGETTVTVQGDGLGGRNQEVALGAVEGLAGLPNTLLICLATDGGDGPTDAAGAAVSGETLARARQAGMRPADFLRRNDAYHFFDALGDLLRTAPTRTNVNDLALLLMP